MTVRVTYSEVLTVYPSATYLGTGTIEAYITTANVLLNDQVQGKTGVTEALLTQMEKYLAVHFAILCYEKGGFIKERIDESEDWYKPNKQDGIMSTWAGQTAVALDPSKTLVNLGKKKGGFKMFPSLDTTYQVTS